MGQAMNDDLFDFLDFGGLGEEQPQEPEQPAVKRTRRRTTQCVELSTRYEYRRAFSETRLLDACGKFEFTPGHSYHFITAGDVDSLSFLKAVLRQQNVTHLLCSTWCMAAEDILQLQQWQDAGKIGTLDLYVGEIFPGSYSVEWQMLQDWRDRGGAQPPLRLPQPLENLCGRGRQVRVCNRDLGKHQHQPAHRAGSGNHRPGALRVLQSIF
jgi:hypothetical protein